MIPFVDLKAQYYGIRQEVDAAILNVLESAEFILGSEVAAFEEEFAAYCGSKVGVGVNSGTSALHLAMLAAGIERGDEVITTPFTFVATVAAIRYVGARPVFVDIDPHTFNIDVSKIESAVTEKTKAIVPVHLYGQPCDMDPIVEIARRYSLVVIEDAAQAHGAEYNGQRAGSFGDLACFSFYPGKNLGAYGEGGMVVTSNPEYARTIRMLRDWGAEKKYHHVLKGYNYRLEGIQAAVLRVKLNHLESWTAARRAHAALYSTLLSDVDVTIPAVMEHTRHVYHIYAVMSPQRDEIHRELTSRGIQTGIHYPFPIYELPAHTDLGYLHGACPIAERAAAQQLSLPMYPELTSAQCEQVASAIKSVVAGSFTMSHS